MPLMSMRGYAKHRGVSPEAVSKAVRTGRISTVTDSDGSRKIDSDVADREWSRNTNPAMQREESPPPEPSSEEATPKEKEKNPYARSRAIRETFAAQMAKLDYQQRIGELTRVSEVQAGAFKTARIVRDAMMAIPDRIAAQLAAESNQFKCHKLMTDEIRRAIEGLKVEMETSE